MSNENYKVLYEHAIDSNIKLVDENKFLKLDNEKILNIIKEVRKYVEDNLYGDYGYECKQSKKELLEILDKLGDSNE